MRVVAHVEMQVVIAKVRYMPSVLCVVCLGFTFLRMYAFVIKWSCHALH